MGRPSTYSRQGSSRGRPARSPGGRLRPWIAALAVFGLLLGACGDEEATDGAVDPPPADDGNGDGNGDGTAPPPPTTEGGTVVVALGTDRETLDGQLRSDRDHLITVNNIFEGLVGRDREGDLIPALATEWEVVDDETWRFQLREGVTFHNGEPWNAEAAAYSIERIIDEDYGSLATTYIRGIAGAEVVSEYVVDIKTDDLLPSLANQLVNVMMVPPGAAEQDGFDANPVGTGAYQFESWDRGRQVTLIRYDDYWGEPGVIDEIVFRTIPDAQAALAALQAGEVDVVLDLLPEQVELVPRAASAAGTEFSNIQFNTIGHEALGDTRVRMALQLAIDLESMADNLYGGFAIPQNQHNVPGGVGYHPDLPPYPHDPDRAEELLAEAGYEEGFEITLHGPFGRFLKGVETVEFIANQWTAIGVDVAVRLWEWNQFQVNGRIPGDEPGALDTRYNWNRNDFYDGSRYFAHVVCGQSSSKFCNDEVDRLFNAAEDTVDNEVRDGLYREAWEILYEEVSHIRLLQHDSITGISDRLDWEPRTDERIFAAEIRLS